MFVYLLTLLLANTCSYSFGNPVINTSETSPPLSSALADLADSCGSPPISSFIKSKVKECSVSPSFADKKQFGCILLLDISSQLCNATAANQVDIQSANLDKIKEFVDVAKLCAEAKTWNASILSPDPKYNETIDEMFKNELVCARACGVEEITSQDSNIYCKFYKWGTEMLAAGINQGRINTASGLPSGEEEADPATSRSNAKGKESHSQNEAALPPKAPANLDPAKANKAVDTTGALQNHPNPSGGLKNSKIQNSAELGGLNRAVNLQSPPQASENPAIENLPGAARNPSVPGASGNEVTNHAGLGANSEGLSLDSSSPKASENHQGAVKNTARQNGPTPSGNEASNQVGVGGNTGNLPLDSSPAKASENHHGVAKNTVRQNWPEPSGNEASNQDGGGGNSENALLDINNNIGAFDYEDQLPEDQVDRNSAQSLGNNENDPVNVRQPSGRSSSSVSINRLEIDDDVDEDHFFSFFLTVIIMVVLLYILYHNKNKVSKVFFGLLVEGRQGRRRNSRGHAYRRLDTLEQAMSTNSAAPPSKIIY